MPQRGALVPAREQAPEVGSFVIVGRLEGTERLVGVDEHNRPAAIRLLDTREAEAARQRASVELLDRHTSVPELARDLDADPAWVASELQQAVDLEEAVARHGPLPRVSVACVATALAEHVVVLHRAGVTDGRLAPSDVLLTASGPRITEPVGLPGGDPPDDVRAWGEVVCFAALGRLPGRTKAVDPDELHGVDLSIADLLVKATSPLPEERPTSETILKVLLGGRLPPEPADAVAAVLTRTWQLPPELQGLIGPGDVRRRPEPKATVKPPRRPVGTVVASGARRTAAFAVSLLIAVVLVLALGYVALRVALR